MSSALSQVLFPELRSLEPGDRAAALRAARRTPLDVLELVALAAALVGAAALRRADLGLALAAGVVGIVMVRRVRRGLRQRADEGSP